MIKIQDAFKAFKNNIIFEHLNLEMNEPGLFVFQGESGSGKSTILNLLAGFESFDSGKMEIDSNIATIFQNYELINEISVQDNILLTKPSLSLEEEKLLEQLGIKELLNYYPNELSGGQKQRVGIARSLLLNPNIILCDEPTESLDVANKKIVMQLLKELSKSKIVIVATHDQKMIDEYADCVYEIHNHLIEKKNDYVSQEKLVHTPIRTSSNQEINQLIKKILRKKTVLASLLLVLLLCVVQGLYFFEKKMFYVPETTNVVNADQLYVEVDNKLLIQAYGFEEKLLTPILKFNNIILDNRKLDVFVYPYVENDLNLEGEKPHGMNVVINQNVAQIIDGAIGKEVTMNYFIQAEQKTMTFTISGIVDESDSTSLSIYYDLESIIQELKNRPNSGMETEWDYIKEKSNFFVYPVTYESLKNWYSFLSEEKQIYLMNTLFDERLEYKEIMVVYQLLFTTFEIFILAGTILIMSIYIIRDTKRYLSICGILVSMQLPLKKIRKCYLMIKIKYFVPLTLLSGGLFYSLYEYMNFKQYMSRLDLAIVFICLGAILVLYIVELLGSIQNLKQSRISTILKDSKD